MSPLPLMLALLVACGGDPHADFVTPVGTLDMGSVLDSEGPLDNLVLNPNFTLPFYINGVGVSSGSWDVVHDVDIPEGQPALDGRGSSSLLFRMVRSPMIAEIWVSSDPADVAGTAAMVVFTEPDTLEDREVELAPVEERILGERRWTLYTGEVPEGDGHGMLVVSAGRGEQPLIAGPVVRVAEEDDTLRSARVPSRPADPRWRALYPAHRPDEASAPSPTGAPIRARP